MLDELDEVVAVNEPLIGHYLSPLLVNTPGVRPDALDAKNFTIRRVQSGKRHQFFASEFRDAWAPQLRRLINERLYAQATRSDSAVSLRRVSVVVKEPNGSESADLIMSVQPRAKLLFLLRDGRDVVDSEIASLEEGSWTTTAFPGIVGVPRSDRLRMLELSAHKWRWRTAVVLEAFAKHPGPKMLIRYEELLADPISHLRRITDWLGVRTSADQIERMVEGHRFDRIPPSERGHHKFHRAATPGLWRENLDERERERLEEIIGPQLREVGYTTDGLDRSRV